MKIKGWIVLRRISQTAFLIFFVYVLWSTTYPLNGPFPAQILFKINPLIMVFTSISERIILPGIIFAAAMLAIALVFGRFFCGWLCPLGSTIDLVGCFRSRRGKDRKEIDTVNAKIRKPKFLLLAVILLFAAAGVELAWVFDPMVIFARFVSLNLIPSVTFAADKSFTWLISSFDLYGPVHDIYRALKSSLLGINIYFFSHSFAIFLFFAAICVPALVVRRLWCRSLCPLGAIYALTAKTALLARRVEACKNCKKCKSSCRMGAIKDDSSYAKGECVLCMDCVYDCPTNITRFAWPVAGRKPAAHTEGISRRDFLFLSALAVSSLGFKFNLKGLRKQRNVVRPPAALQEEEFVNRCVRCGNCMKVCPTNGLQPVSFQSGLQGVWTPQLVPEIGYCEYNCTLCGNTCPTGAIRRLSLDQKHVTVLGIAKVDRSICIPWVENRQCVVCEEHCPTPDKAIKLKKDIVSDAAVLRPLVDGNLCVGCGICQTKCPTRPRRAIKVLPF